MRDIKQFTHSIAQLELTELETAIALVWFFAREGRELNAREIADLMQTMGLRGAINTSRLSKSLSKSRQVVSGKAKGSFRIRLADQTSLDKRYGCFVRPLPPKVSDLLLESDSFEGTRNYLEKLVYQINGSYQFQFYDACAVLSRRLMETLLIHAFEKAGHEDEIQNAAGNFLQLAEIIGVAGSNKYVRFARGSSKTMEKLKSVGDTAAHSKSYITKKPDIDDIKLEYRRLIDELMHLSGLVSHQSKKDETS